MRRLAAAAAEDAVLNAEALEVDERDEKDERDLTRSNECFERPPLLPLPPPPQMASASRDLV